MDKPSKPDYVVAIYARVSTSDKGQDISLQVDPLKTYCLRQGWIYTVYEENLSGAEGKYRPKLERLMQDCRMGCFHAVLVWKLDRFSRSIVDFITMVKELDRLKVRFIATTQGIDTDQSNPGSRLFMQILAAFAEFEREIIRERINAGLAKRKALGLPMGRRKGVMDLERARAMIDNKYSLREVAGVLRVDKETLRRRLASG